MFLKTTVNTWYLWQLLLYFAALCLGLNINPLQVLSVPGWPNYSHYFVRTGGNWESSFFDFLGKYPNSLAPKFVNEFNKYSMNYTEKTTDSKIKEWYFLSTISNGWKKKIMFSKGINTWQFRVGLCLSLFFPIRQGR